MTKVYELVYKGYCSGGYHTIAFSLDKSMLQALVDKAREFDEYWQAELQKFESIDGYRIEWEVPSDFPLLGQDWFDASVFFSSCENYNGNCVENMEIKEHLLL